MERTGRPIKRAKEKREEVVVCKQVNLHEMGHNLSPPYKGHRGMVKIRANHLYLVCFKGAPKAIPGCPTLKFAESLQF